MEESCVYFIETMPYRRQKKSQAPPLRNKNDMNALIVYECDFLCLRSYGRER